MALQSAIRDGIRILAATFASLVLATPASAGGVTFMPRVSASAFTSDTGSTSQVRFDVGSAPAVVQSSGATDSAFASAGFTELKARAVDTNAAGSASAQAFAEDAVTLYWNSASPVSGSGTLYDVVRGVGSGFPVGSGSETCVAAGHPPAAGMDPTVSLEVTAEPDPGELHWYIVRPTNPCGVGHYGTTSDGSPRVSGACG